MAMDEALVLSTPHEKKKTRSMLQSKTKKIVKQLIVEIPNASARQFAKGLRPATELQYNVKNSLALPHTWPCSSIITDGKWLA